MILSRAEKLGRGDAKLYLTLARACLKTGRHCRKKYVRRAYLRMKTEESILLYASLFPSESGETLADGVKLFPRSTALHLALGWWWQKRDPKHATRFFTEAKQLDKGDPEAYYALGLLAEEAGRRKDAERLYRKALFLNPLHIRSAEGLKRTRSR